MKKNGLCELVFILDRSGSMSGLEADTIGGFNSLIEKQKKEEGECLVSTVLFDNRHETVHDRIPLEEIGKLTEKEYYVRGSTALLDAVGATIEKLELIYRYARPEDVPEKTMVVITTDGMENASTRFTADKVKKLVKKKTEEGWEFLFLGANIDAVSAAGDIGIRPERAARYRCDSKGTDINFKAVGAAVSCMRSSAPIEDSWAAEVENYYEENAE